MTGTRGAKRLLTALVAAVALLAATAGPALAHAQLLQTTPSSGERGVGQEITSVTLRFSEGVQVLNRSDVSVVDARGHRIDAGGARTAPGDSSRVVVGLRGPLLPSSYTVRYRVVSDDSHAEGGALVFGVGKAPLGKPVVTGVGGLTDSSAPAVAARIAELLALGLLVGLLAFRVLVWGPAVEATSGLGGAEREAVLRGGARRFWRAFWTLTIVAGFAEAGVLAVKSAVVFHTGVLDAVLKPDAAYRLVAASRFGDLLGWRSAALAAMVGVALVAWSTEQSAPPGTGRRDLQALMALFGLAALTLLAGQGHASQAPLAPLSVAADATHLAGAAVWIGGLPCLAAVLLRAPGVVPGAGRALAGAALARFSRVALWAVAVIAVTGLARLAGELSSPDQLWNTAYGRDLLLKAELMLPVLLLARRHRRVVAALRAGGPATAARLRSVGRTLQVELGLALAIVAVAAVLVAQVPGRV
jgi:copper transport protein